MTDLYTAQHEGLVTVHRKLAGAFQAVIDAAHEPMETLIQRARGAGGFLLGHHHAEDSVLFPGLRKYGQLRSTDVAFLATRDAEHHALHALCERFTALTDRVEIVICARELSMMLNAHVAFEEEGLTPARLREMVSVEGFTALTRELDELRARLGPPPA
jgi:hemerythrin-like domain-containing protein